jgi:succinate dehydrogenase / fumarate reductase iron-sulfur subunit
VKIRLRVWRQAGPRDRGRFQDIPVEHVSPDSSFLEMLDGVNEKLLESGEEPIAFDSDCREGICGACGMVVNGSPHGPLPATTTCQLHMRHFQDGDLITVEPWRANAFPVIKDLVVDRGAFDRVIQAGGFVSVETGSAPEANAIPVPKDLAEAAFDSAACIGCGACVAACPNASAMLFVGAKVSHLALLPQGQPERFRRVVAMVEQMDAEGFGGCTNHGECEAACPKEIPMTTIYRMNGDLVRALFRGNGLRERRVRAPRPQTAPARLDLSVDETG